MIEYEPFGKLVLAKAMLPSAALHEVGAVTEPAAIVGVAGSLKVFNVASEPVHPVFVIEKAL
ncbi:MAG: hypothetical protein EAZ32_11610 [Cytophagia bacterium]|nr:MAG: hypothetical protein EAZ46_06220 [Runella sp.]TAG19452.1 MAG: hypothetical protein EAZ38_12345 [Cytophagales bacterium]TAG38733.1 MAG: hypothetical protein EAZ32_11610 [Cytophagia bacterium]TAG80300.1 MAG: hypothetical protein EAZ22_09690 [Cytophagales bacterium]